MNTVNARSKALTAAAKIHESEGVDGLSMRHVASALGVTATALYRHFSDKEALLGAIADSGFEDLEERLAAQRGRVKSPVKAIMQAFLLFAFEQPRMYHLMFHVPRRLTRKYPEDFAAGKSKSFNVLRDAVTDEMRRGAFRRDDVLETSLSVWAHAHGLISMFNLGRFSGGRDEFTALYNRSMNRLLKGLRA